MIMLVVTMCACHVAFHAGLNEFVVCEEGIVRGRFRHIMPGEPIIEVEGFEQQAALQSVEGRRWIEICIGKIVHSCLHETNMW